MLVVSPHQSYLLVQGQCAIDSRSWFILPFGCCSFVGMKALQLVHALKCKIEFKSTDLKLIQISTAFAQY
ncbi:hypothetical protein AYR47_02610 [Pseudomonas azotoformans]|uniref:Uncharacterized protein n=1 Tax=Pseudomonas azotoformans TaxID=47878 RepID=A0A127HRU3_PSEAZ|nr:hypothetical protein AYR47_02610 [Pseudomonas azotoformans]